MIFTLISIICILFSLLLFIIIFVLLKYKNIKKEQSKFKLLVESTKDYLMFLYQILPEEKFIYVSPSSVLINGYTPEDHYANPHLLLKLVYPEDIPIYEFQREFPKLTNKPLVMRWIKKDGKVIWTEHRYTNILNKQGDVISIEGIVKDVTEQKETEFALRESEKKFKELFNHANDFIFLMDVNKQTENFKFLEINKIASLRLGIDKEKIKNITFLNLINDDKLEETKKNLVKIIENKYYDFETFFIDKNSDKILVDINAHLFKLEGNNVVLIIARDVTEKRKIEYEMQKAQKLESLGILAGGIAHDFNNMLTGILGNVSLARFSVDTNDRIVEFLLEAEKVIYKAKDLTLQLLSFSKGWSPIKEAGSISKLVRETSTFLVRGSNTKCIFSLSENLWVVEYDEGQMVQVINNLVINAMQSMSSGGIIEIKGANLILKENNELQLQSGKYVKLSFIDQGVGIPKENITRIFDPFFTTKNTGTGIGLTSSYSIIKKHGGAITVESDVGKGTSFHIFLPASQKQQEGQSKKDGHSIGIIKKGTGRILVMDDNDDIRNTAKKLIEQLGYVVYVTKEGKETIETYQQNINNNTPFDVVILDLTIQGGMGGKETIQKLYEINPNIKAIVSSGYSNDPIMANYREYGFSDIISKPYTVEKLSETLYKLTTK